MRLISKFFAVNSRLSSRLDRKLNPDHGDLYRKFYATVEKEFGALPPGAVAVDLGGGRRCEYAHAVPAHGDVRLVAVDISEKELAANVDVTDTRTADVAKGLPFGDAEVDLIVSNFLLEHVDGVPAAVEHMARVLKPGGRTIHFLPCRYSTFATAARLLPFGPLLKVLHLMIPETKGHVEFDVHYDHGYPIAMERLFRSVGFRYVSVETTPISASYFFPFLPAYLLVWAYESLVRRIDARSLMAYMMVSAER